MITQKIKPLVTIGIPTYNRADNYLKQTLRSAVNQTYSNIEIIVSDNCSTDNTEEVVAEFSDKRMKYFKQNKNIDMNDNFNFCLNQAHGDYFLLLHDDDLIDGDFADVCMKSANYNTDIGVIRTGTRTIDSNENTIYKAPNRVGGLSNADFFSGWFAGTTELYFCSTLFNTKKLMEIGGFQSKHHLFQDGVAIVQLAAKFGRIDIQDVKASFRMHSLERTFETVVNAWCEDSLFLLNIMCNLIPEYKNKIRNEGMKFFSKINYYRAAAISSPLKRHMTYLMVFKKFEYRYSPISFFLKKYHFSRRGRGIKRKIKQLLNTPSALSI